MIKGDKKIIKRKGNVMSSLCTEKGKEFALKKLSERRKSKPEQIDNGSLPAG
ncbi:hypothetical protein LCGC14_2896050, partial [marine sediment metagenome]